LNNVREWNTIADTLAAIAGAFSLTPLGKNKYPMLSFKPRLIVIHPDVSRHPVTKGILEKTKHIPFVIQAAPPPASGSINDPVGYGKRIWFLTASPGNLVKECPATPHQLCCRYRVINLITNCPIDCSYCILQGYITNSYITIHINLKDVYEQIDMHLASHPHHIVRFGTGELSDSLALEAYTGFCQELVHFFKHRNKAFFEIKTKYHDVERLLELEPEGNIGVSWSINPEEIIRQEEHGASTLKQRLKAAQRCQEKGYLIGFHFDPIFHYPEWEQGYRSVIDRIFSRVDTRRISWISLGGFRYPTFLKSAVQERFPESRILLGELFPGPDGKFRYFKQLRIELYRKIVSWLRHHDPQLFIYFCMESPDVWTAVFGEAPESRDHLDQRFSQHLQRIWSA